jgi:hypothetical protein
MRDAPPQNAIVFDSGGEVPSEYDVFCEGCGYSLVGIVTDRCPECGRSYDPAELPFARIPWLHRRRIGRWRAYGATVWMILRHPRRFALELCRPVRISAADARLFRWVTLRLALICAVLSFLPVIILNQGWRLSGVSVEQLIEPAIVTVVFCAAFAVFLMLATDMPLFIWKGLPSRPPGELAPVHHYASAPLALSPLLAALVVAANVAIRILGDEQVAFLIGLGVTFAMGLLALLMWALSLVLMRVATGCRAGRVAALAIYLPVHWLLSTLVAALGFAVVVTILHELIPGFL